MPRRSIALPLALLLSSALAACGQKADQAGGKQPSAEKPAEQKPEAKPARDTAKPAERTPETATDEALVKGMAKEHATDTPIATPISRKEPAVAIKVEQVKYGARGEIPLMGHLALPETATPPLHGVIVIQEWWGLNDNIKQTAEWLAGEGYVALAVDLYGGQVADTPEKARMLMQAALKDPAALVDNLKQAHGFLKEQYGTPRTASIGWCFGGGLSLQLALAVGDRLDAAVMFYGRVEQDTEKLKTLSAPLLGLFGEADQGIPVDGVQAFKKSLTELKKDAHIRIYKGAGHAFANPSGQRYEARSAEDAWRRTVAFLDEHLKRGQ